MPDIDVAIIGSGPAGLTAAIYAARADLRPVVFAGADPGGQLMWTTEVENFPGFAQGILGPNLMEAMKQQAIRFGTTVEDRAITKVDFSRSPFKLWSDTNTWSAKTVIIATGASAKWLGLPNEQRLRGKGVSACATCDGFFFKGKEVVVIGGGDAAMEEALYLTKFAPKVTVLVRTEKLRASKIMAERAKQHPQITFRWNTEVVDVVGVETVTGLKLKDSVTETEEDFPCQGVFLAIGHKPNTEIFTDQLAKNPVGYLVAKDQVFSSIPGIFIAGDVSDFRYRQAVSAAGWGCMAALEAERFLSGAHL